MAIIDTIAATISLSVLLTAIVPFFLSWYKQSWIYFYFGLASIGGNFLNGILKLVFHPDLNDAFKRPPEAQNCNSINRGGKCGGNAGFPSGHTQSTVFFVLFLYLLSTQYAYTSEYSLSPLTEGLLVVGLLWIVLVAWSRMHRRCHTLLQVIFGAIVGILYTYVIYRIFQYFEWIK